MMTAAFLEAGSGGAGVTGAPVGAETEGVVVVLGVGLAAGGVPETVTGTELPPSAGFSDSGGALVRLFAVICICPGGK